jgi:phosphatidate cytidylyltransferase
MFRERFLVTTIIGSLGLYLIYLGSWFYFIPTAGFLVLATIEFSKLTHKLDWRVPTWLLLPVAAAFWLLTVPKLVGWDLDLAVYSPQLLVVGMLASMTFGLWLYEKRPQEKALGSWFALVVGVMLLGWLGSHFFRLRTIDQMAAEWTGLTLLTSWSADSAAYMVGRSIGRHKFSPRLSPKKTVEGYIGGIVFGTLITAIAASIIGMDIIQVIIFSLVINIVTPAGDLGMSLLKREAAVKDSGTFLPGHGGALDRLDTIVWSVTIAFYLIPIIS